MSNGIKSWSPSRLSDYEQCPRKVKYGYVDALCTQCFGGRMEWVGNTQICNRCHQPPPPAPALDRGTELHEVGENYIRGLREDYPGMEQVSGWLEMLRAEFAERRVRVEVMLAMNSKWQVTQWKSRDGWLRLKIDVLWLFEPGQVCVIDWKTGKLKKKWGDADSDALDIYNVAALSAGFGQAAQAKLIYTDYNFAMPDDLEEPDRGRIKNDTISMEELVDRQKHWTSRATRMMTDTKFNTHPGYQCKWCSYSRNIGGPCDY